MIVFTQSHFFNYRRLIQVSGFDRNKLSWYPVLWNLTRQFCTRRLKIYWRFSVSKIIDIGPALLEIFENITSVRFLRHSVYGRAPNVPSVLSRDVPGRHWRPIRRHLAPPASLGSNRQLVTSSPVHRDNQDVSPTARNAERQHSNAERNVRHALAGGRSEICTLLFPAPATGTQVVHRLPLWQRWCHVI